MVSVENIPIIQIGVIVLVSFVFGTILARLGFSSAVGYIIGGMILGPLGLNYLTSEGAGIGVATIFGELGVMMLLFYLGLELNIKRFKETGAVATVMAALEMILAFVMGYLISKYFGFSDLEALVVGSMLTATSTVITSKFIIEKGLIETVESRIVISILILEDFLAILILVFITSLVEQKSLNFLVVNAVIFVIAMFFLVSKISKHVLNLLNTLGYEDQMWLYAIGIFITVAYFGNSYLGLTPALGAYFAGFALSESAYGEKIKKELGMFREFFVLFFFVSFGAKATLPTNPTVYAMLIALVIGYVLTKLLSEVIFGTALGMELKSAVTGGLLMGSVGEFSLIIATALEPLHLPNGGEILSLAFLLTLLTTTTMPIAYSQKDRITALFEKIYPRQLRRIGVLERQFGALDKFGRDIGLQNEYGIALRKLFQNLVIAVSIVYLSYVANFQVELPFAPLFPSKLSVSLLILPLVLWPIYKFINELKFLTRRVANSLLTHAFPTKDRNVIAIEKEIGDVFSGVVLVLIGIITTAFLYLHYKDDFLFLLIPATYTIISIMYLSKSIYGLIEQYEQLEEELGAVAEDAQSREIAEVSREFDAHAKLFHELQSERLEAKERIQDAIRTNNLALAKQALSNFKRTESRALINIFDVKTLQKYPKLQELLKKDIDTTRSASQDAVKVNTKEAFMKYMQEHLKPQLYEMEISRLKKNKRKK